MATDDLLLPVPSGVSPFLMPLSAFDHGMMLIG
jgi:hypothetical protein